MRENNVLYYIRGNTEDIVVFYGLMMSSIDTVLHTYTQKYIVYVLYVCKMYTELAIANR